MEKIGDDVIHPSVCSTTQCGANLARGKNCANPFRAPAVASALRQIRATSAREKGRSVTEFGFLRASVPLW
jgi:hypothetical protein